MRRTIFQNFFSWNWREQSWDFFQPRYLGKLMFKRRNLNYHGIKELKIRVRIHPGHMQGCLYVLPVWPLFRTTQSLHVPLHDFPVIEGSTTTFSFATLSPLEYLEIQGKRTCRNSCNSVNEDYLFWIIIQDHLSIYSIMNRCTHILFFKRRFKIRI